MKEDNSNMTTGPIVSKLIRFAIPILMSNLLSQLYVIVDSLVISNCIGDAALAAVTNCINLAWMITALFFGMGLGIGVVVSQAYGAKRYEWLSRSVHTAIAVSALAGLVIALLSPVITETLLRWIQTPEDVMADSTSYLTIYLLGVMGSMLTYGCTDILQAMGDSKRPLYVMICSTITNVVLDLLFVAVFGWGIPGAAWATVLAIYLGSVLSLVLLCRAQGPHRLHLSRIRIHMDSLKAILKMGIPTGIENCAVSLANTIVQASVNSFGTVVMTAIGATASIEGFAFLPMTAFSGALGTFTGQNVGAGQEERTRKGIKFGLICMVILSFAIGLLLMALARPGIMMFSRDEEVIAYGVRRMVLVCGFYPLCGLTHCFASAFRGSGKPMIPMGAYMGFWCGLRILILLTVLPLWHSFDLLALVYPITWAGSALTEWAFYRWYPWFPSKKKLEEPSEQVLLKVQAEILREKNCMALEEE